MKTCHSAIQHATLFYKIYMLSETVIRFYDMDVEAVEKRFFLQAYIYLLYKKASQIIREQHFLTEPVEIRRILSLKKKK